jgi:hypothetical protein
MKKYLSFFILLNIGFSTVKAQSNFTFNYDSAGNRTWRALDIIESRKTDTSLKDRPFTDTNSSNNLIASVYPNPTHGKLIIDVSNLQAVCRHDICLYNTWNNLITYQVSYVSVIDLDLTSLSKGLYYLRITSGNFSYKHVIILE